MSSVTKRIEEIKQPRGGYIKLSQFDVHEIEDGKVLNQTENIHASIIGMAVDYLSRFMTGSEIKKAFLTSYMGAYTASLYGQKDAIKEAEKYLKNIRGLDDNSIINACKLVTFDVWFRAPVKAVLAKTASQISPDIYTIENIRIMVERSMLFWKNYGPVIKDGFTFERTGYTSTVDSGDGDFLTQDTLWEYKVIKSKPSTKHTLQLLMYWIMGQHCGKAEFKDINKIGIFNPRLNTIYLLNIRDISKDVIEAVETNVICY